MPVESLTPDQSALNRSKYLVLEFDPRDGTVSVLDSMGYSEDNLGDALRDAQVEAEARESEGTTRQYVVVSVSVLGAYRATR